jgi:hypothetical protein
VIKRKDGSVVPGARFTPISPGETYELFVTVPK